MHGVVRCVVAACRLEVASGNLWVTRISNLFKTLIPLLLNVVGRVFDQAGLRCHLFECDRFFSTCCYCDWFCTQWRHLIVWGVSEAWLFLELIIFMEYALVDLLDLGLVFVKAVVRWGLLEDACGNGWCHNIRLMQIHLFAVWTQVLSHGDSPDLVAGGTIVWSVVAMVLFDNAISNSNLGHGNEFIVLLYNGSNCLLEPFNLFTFCFIQMALHHLPIFE